MSGIDKNIIKMMLLIIEALSDFYPTGLFLSCGFFYWEIK
jgi:hypothetical protein